MRLSGDLQPSQQSGRGKGRDLPVRGPLPVAAGERDIAHAARARHRGIPKHAASQVPELELKGLLIHILQAPAAARKRAAAAPLSRRSGRIGCRRCQGSLLRGVRARVLSKEEVAVLCGRAVALVQAREQALRVRQQRRRAQPLRLQPASPLLSRRAQH